MDIILEIVDTLVLDRVYATLLPASTSQYLHHKVSNAVTSTFSSIREGATPAPQYTYIYEPASKILSLTPTEWAFRSAWPRDNIYRQGISLFAIVWYARVLYKMWSLCLQTAGSSDSSSTLSAPPCRMSSCSTRRLSNIRNT
jgi:hypothetical protein